MKARVAGDMILCRPAGARICLAEYPQLALWATGMSSASPTLNYALTKILFGG
jgi:hypothetical protein